MTRPTTRAASTCVAVALAAACTAPGDATILLDLGAARSELNLIDTEATLDVLDAQGRAVAVELAQPVEGAPQLLQSPLPIPCPDAQSCAVALRLPPGSYSFVLHLIAGDRCGTRTEVLRFTSGGPYVVPALGVVDVELVLERADFDGDGDGVPALLELATCGRLDVDDAALPPAACVSEEHPCCKDAAPSPLEGRQTAFAGGAHARADGSTADVAPFALDATEATVRQLARCVAAGACLAGQPEHPARLAIANGADARSPAVGLTPKDAGDLCRFFGKRLPLDDEWDFAAAHRDVALGGRGRYPWDGDDVANLARLVDPTPVRAPPGDDGAIGCSSESASGIAANHRAHGQPDCPGAPVAVGSYPSSHVRRGAGPPLADMGGNVPEWTRVAGAAPSTDGVPEGSVAVVLRGGGAESVIELLENDLPIVARLPASGDTDAWASTVRRLAATAGVRCAADVNDGTVVPTVTAEPSCGP